MTDTTTSVLADLERRLAAGEAFGRADAERISTCADLIGVGVLGEAARRAARGARVTFGRVLTAGPGAAIEPGEAGEVRLIDAGTDRVALVARVREARAAAGRCALTGFTVPELLALAGGDRAALAGVASDLAAAGLESVADAPIDRLGDAADPIEIVRALQQGGLGVWRATVTDAQGPARLDVIERAAAIQDATGAFRAFAPLPLADSRDEPATGYDDVRTIAAARLRCMTIPSIQVDWQIYGPKLAQVAIAYGADDLDNVPAVDTVQLGHRRSPREDLERQIRSAFAEPAERNGRFEVRA
ncbi:MAG: hypothetical protein R2752_09690 [Vicinamibacterales bacterium]